MSKIKHGHSLEITKKLSPKAATTIAQWIGCSSVIYNQKTKAAKNNYSEWLKQKKPENERPIENQQVAYLSQEFPFLKKIPSQIRRNAGAKWFEAYNAAKSGLRNPPKVKAKHKKRNCYVTQELFDIQALDEQRCLIQVKEDATKKNKGNYLFGVVMPFPKEDAGNALYLSRKGARFWLSMSFDVELDVLDEETLKEMLVEFSDEDLDELVVGYDLGVKKQVASSNKETFHFSIEEREKLALLEKRKIKAQRKYARRVRANNKNKKSIKRKATIGEKKVLKKITKYDEKRANIRQNRSHHISKKIAEETPLIAVFEDLKLKNMTKRPKAKQDPKTGKWLKNGASAKSGLSKSLLNVNLGQIRKFSEYKLKEEGKLFIKVNPAYTSQTCSNINCGHKDPKNRITQEKFKCIQCGYEDNADYNAAKVIKLRGLKYLRSEKFFQKKKSRALISFRKQKVTEQSSLDSGGDVSHSIKNALSCEAINSLSRAK